MHYDVKTLLHLKYFQICCSKVYHINTSFSTSCMRVSPVKWKSQNEWFSIKSRSHHTQSIRNKYIRKLLLGYNKILETKCFYITIKTHESTVSIIQLHNPAKLRKWKNKYTVQFLKVEFSPFATYFGKSPHMESPSRLKAKKHPNPLKKIFENQKVPLHHERKNWQYLNGFRFSLTSIFWRQDPKTCS